MAVEDFQELIIAPCIDNDALQTNFDSLNALVDEMNKGTFDVTCDSIDTSFGGRNTTGEECSVLFEKLPINTLGAESQKCLFLLTMKITAEVVGQSGIIPFFVFPFNYSIKCGGVTVHQGSTNANQTISTFFQVDCPVGAEIEVCAEYAGVALSTTIDWTMDLCGGRMCISPRDVGRTGATVPCTVKPECCYGFDALSLMVQSMNALCSAFQFGGKTIRCVQVVANENESIAVSVDMPTNTTYAVFGTVKVCFDSGASGDINVVVKPVIGCESSQANCIAGTVAPIDVNGAANKVCFKVPVATCGECPAGESLYVGQNPELQCNEVADPQAGTIGYSLQAEYTVWLFEDIVNDNLTTIPYPPRCLTTNYLVRLRDKGNDLNEAVCRRSIPNCTVRCEKYTVENPSNGQFPLLTIQEAQIWTPPVNDPTAPAPPKKWFLSGDFFVCHADRDTGLEDYQSATVEYEILCGGVPYISPNSGQAFSDSCAWQLAGSGSFFRCSPNVDIAGIIECPIDEDLEIRVNVSTAGFGIFTGPWTLYGEIKAICF